MKIGIVCCGNILRSQVLCQYLIQAFNETSYKAEVFSCGVSDSPYPDELILIKDVEDQLKLRGINVKLKRNRLNSEFVNKIKESSIVLVADKETKSQLLHMTGINSSKVFLFYEFINEGIKDFQDTYDYILKKQNKVSYDHSINELMRIAYLTAERISEYNKMDSKPSELASI